ncbi:MAG: glutaminyl-peptide cyclotransferase [Candidatus Bathyarchaeota archaeon]|nr:glutaminyl-peptide cyclotransferase [Candidatus Bathyarchaeum tardum]
MKRQNSIVIVTFLVVVAVFSIVFILHNNTINEPSEPQEAFYHTYEIINSYPHDESAFTQGLVIEDGILYEGTGLEGHSTLRRVDIETGEVKQQISLSNNLFGEGITVFKDEIIQLTWTSNIGFVYNKTTFELLRTFNYTTEGWGLTHNGSMLIMSNGTSTLNFLDPQTFEIINQIDVYNEEGPVTMLNELEYINGSIYANIWQEDTIVIINPKTGNVTGQIDLTGLKDLVNQTSRDVLNGIAYDQNENRFFVTGKFWSKLFEIKLVPME